MLLTKEVEVGLSGTNIKWYEEKGYNIPRVKDKYYHMSVPRGTKIKVNIKDLSYGSESAKVEVKCDNCGDILNIRWKDYKKNINNNGTYYCFKCAMKKYGTKHSLKTRLKNSKSFEQWCIENNRQDVLDRWDYELNKISPNEVFTTTHKKYYLKCPHGIHQSELKSIGELKTQRGSMKCIQCNTVAHTYPNLIKYFLNVQDAYNSIGSSKEVPLKCPDCGYIKNMKISIFIQFGLACPQCGDGFSYPNKLMLNILKQLNINFKTEYSPNWIKPKRYDFYFKYNNQKYIIEMDGGWHTKDNILSGQTIQESQAIDDYKDKMALLHHIKVIRINCKKSDLIYIQDNILNSKLAYILDLSNVDWVKCHKNACKSLTKLICDSWNNGIDDVKKIADIFNINRVTVVNYLKKGAELNLCNYNVAKQKTLKRVKVICLNTKEVFESVKDVKEKCNINISGCLSGQTSSAGIDINTGEKLQWMYYNDYVNKKQPPLIKTTDKKVFCINTCEIFNSAIQASVKYKINNSSIGKCCKNKINCAGVHPITKENLTWTYYDYYISLNEKDKEQLLKAKISKSKQYMIVCINSNEIFMNAKIAGDKYKIGNSDIIKCCKNKTKSCGKHPETGEKLRWMYYEDYIKQQENKDKEVI